MDYFDEKQIDWQIINSYFNSNKYYFTTFQIDSYNDFVLNKLPYTIKALNPITMLKKHDNGNIKHEVNIYVGDKDGDKIYLGKPVLHVDKEINHYIQMKPDLKILVIWLILMLIFLLNI